MRTITLAIAGLLLLASCSDEPTPIEPPASSPGAPSPTPPSLPALATKDTPEGAGQFVRFWVASFNYAAKTGRSELMTAHARRCEPCHEYAEDFERLPPADRPTGPAWNLKRVTVVLSRNPIEVETEMKVEGESKLAHLTFVLNDGAPFRLTDIYEKK